MGIGTTAPRRTSIGGATAFLLLTIAGGLMVALGVHRGPLVIVAFVGAGVLAFLAIARYHLTVGLGFVLFSVLIVEPAVPDVVLGVVIVVAVATGRWTFERLPPSILFALGVFFVLNLLAMAIVESISRAVFFVGITAYLLVFAVWVTSYVTSQARARRIMAPLLIGATVTAALGVLALFVRYPGSAEMLLNGRARGLFKDPNVFGPFLILPVAFALAEMVEPSLLSWRRGWLAVVVIVCGAGVMFSYSRAAWLNAAVTILTMTVAYALRRGSFGRAFVATGFATFAAGVVALALFLTGSTAFLVQRAHLQSYDADRFRAQDASFELARSYPLGIGPGQYDEAVNYAAHSTFLRALGEEGALGMAVLAFVLFATVVFACGNVIHGRTTSGISSVPLLGLWLGLIANSFFVDTLHWRHLWLVAALIWVGATPVAPRAGGLALLDSSVVR